MFVVREILSLFSTATVIENDKTETLRESSITLTNSFWIPTTVCVHVDGIPAFQSLSRCPILNKPGITVEIGRTKNPNKNDVVKKAINELEKEIKQFVFIEKPINSSTLSLALGALNNRIRFNRFNSSRETLYQHDQFTGKQLIFQDDTLSSQRECYGK